MEGNGKPYGIPILSANHPSDNYGDKEGVIIGKNQDAWYLYEAKMMPLRVNERSYPETIKQFQCLQKYSNFLETKK